ncbi:Ubiquinone biosynthesis O-methyltransferase [uncultured archaeon]|nr:Ubiquinone biosynthesis O-methyltransferase [uncultured archaeon]
MMKDANNYEFEVNLNDKNHASTKAIELIGFNKKVLEFGCATGFISKILKDRGCAVTGIEIDKNAAKKAEEHCGRVIVGNLENLDFNKSLGDEKFDVIYFGDVLEHLKDPKRILLGIRNFLGKEGYLVISIPNIAHWSTRLELFNGNFDYQKIGILDDSHLRFFTKKSITNLLESCGYFIEAIDNVEQFDRTIINNILKMKGFNEIESYKIFLMLSQSGAEAYQYVIKAPACSEFKYIEKLSNEKISLEQEIKEKNINIAEKDKHIGELQNVVLEKDKQIQNLEHNLETTIADNNKRINDIYSSTSWKITSPLRYFHSKLTKR